MFQLMGFINMTFLGVEIYLARKIIKALVADRAVFILIVIMTVVILSI